MIDFNDENGTVGFNTYGTKMTIIQYIDWRNVIVKFENGYTTSTYLSQFKSGKVKNPIDKNIFNVGFLGEGSYKSTLKGKITNQYSAWKSMMRRCYSEKEHVINPTYTNCTVCDEWHNFQNFSEWYDENYYEIEGQTTHLDKDILHKGNKLYSPETCVFVPQCINKLFVKSDSIRGEYPIGVYYEKSRNKYVSQFCNGNGHRQFIGRFDTSNDAFYNYKKYKEHYIKEIANQYKIPEILYNALILYTCDITD